MKDLQTFVISLSSQPLRLGKTGLFIFFFLVPYQ